LLEIPSGIAILLRYGFYVYTGSRQYFTPQAAGNSTLRD